MAELKDIFALEAEREMPESWNKIHLYKVGDFWRAYEWSAWLVAVITYNDEVRMQKKLQQVDLCNREAALRSVNSYLGIMSHTASYNLRRSMFGEGEFAEMIEYDADMRKGWLVA